MKIIAPIPPATTKEVFSQWRLSKKPKPPIPLTNLHHTFQNLINTLFQWQEIKIAQNPIKAKNPITFV